MFSVPSVESVIETMWRRLGLPAVVHSLISTVIITFLLTIILSKCYRQLLMSSKV